MITQSIREEFQSLISRYLLEFEELCIRLLESAEQNPNFNFYLEQERLNDYFFSYRGRFVSLIDLICFESDDLFRFASDSKDHLMDMADDFSRRLLDIQISNTRRLVESPVYAPTTKSVEGICLPVNDDLEFEELMVPDNGETPVHFSWRGKPGVYHQGHITFNGMYSYPFHLAMSDLRQLITRCCDVDSPRLIPSSS
ncbi:hypothetical protein [Methylomonas rhizoryzae]|uniref:hypothetical protein n=1 Tax=Methylomonas rhizoryzae TaxID=2608981 RepID=UPI00123286D2|nr:hypothetical protein [Methylomonas rhizoryzae]